MRRPARHPPPLVRILRRQAEWKGTEVCLDFYCTCGGNGHYDGGFAYGLRCGDCGATWILPHMLPLTRGEEDQVVMQEPIMQPRETPPGPVA